MWCSKYLVIWTGVKINVSVINTMDYRYSKTSLSKTITVFLKFIKHCSQFYIIRLKTSTLNKFLCLHKEINKILSYQCSKSFNFIDPGSDSFAPLCYLKKSTVLIHLSGFHLSGRSIIRTFLVTRKFKNFQYLTLKILFDTNVKLEKTKTNVYSFLSK